jgi:hypothetical protein
MRPPYSRRPSDCGQIVEENAPRFAVEKKIIFCGISDKAFRYPKYGN